MVKLVARTLREHERRIEVLENFCRRIEDTLLLSMDFNPFLECCRNETDQEILKFLVKHQRATTSMIARGVNQLGRKKSLKPITRNACYFRVKYIEKKCEERIHPGLLTFHYKKNDEGLMRYWAVDPLIVDMLRDQAKELETREEAEMLERSLL